MMCDFLAGLVTAEIGQAVQTNQDALLACGKALADDISQASGLDADLVFAELAHIPDNMLALLESPEGWSALAQYVAADLGVHALDYRPQIH